MARIVSERCLRAASIGDGLWQTVVKIRVAGSALLRRHASLESTRSCFIASRTALPAGTPAAAVSVIAGPTVRHRGDERAALPVVGLQRIDPTRVVACWYPRGIDLGGIRDFVNATH